MTSVLVRREGRAGRITLNRPDSINALTHKMVIAIANALDDWERDPDVATVVLDGAGERGFCAGGDIVALYKSALAGNGDGQKFWRDEYTLNARIRRYSKPIVAVMHGLVLGGGVGLACHASHRLVTASTKIGLPETGIGFFPDVGATWLLGQAPGELGVFAGLTGRMLSASEAIDLGLADTFVADPDAVAGALADENVGDVVARFSTPTPQSDLVAEREWIDTAFSGIDVGAILGRLDAGNPLAQEAARTIRQKSPTSSAVTLSAIRGAQRLPDLEAALVREFRIAVRVSLWPDFVEGIRAQVIDKDRRPRWTPDNIHDVVAERVARLSEPLRDDLQLQTKGIS